MALEGTVKVPGAGAVPKKYAAGGLVLVTILTGTYYYRKHKAAAPAAAAAAATPADQFPPDGTSGNPADPYSTDPASGQTYGNESAGSGGTLGAFGTGAASGMYYDPATGAYDLTSPYGTGGTGVTGGTGTGGPPFATNSAWSNWVIAQLQAINPEINIGALTDAVGLYLEGQPVSAAQRTLIFDATAVAGDPPVAGPNGYPPKVRLAGSGGGAVSAENPVRGLKASAVRKTSATVSWNAEPHETGYSAKITTGHSTVRTQSGAGHSVHVSGLKQKTKYEVAVLAKPAAAGARAGTVSFTTA